MTIYLYVSLFIMILLALVVISFSTKRSILIHLLIVSFLLGPRIPLGNLSDVQRLDFRFDDLIIFVMIFCGSLFFLSKKIKVKYPSYNLYLLLFVVTSVLSTAFGTLVYDQPIISSTLFLMRGIEYILLSFVIPFFIVREDNIYKFFKTFCYAMTFNIAWFCVQLVTGMRGQLIRLVDVRSYGFGLVAESQISDVASIFYCTFILCLVVFVNYRTAKILLPFILFSAIGLVSSLSRSILAGTLLSLVAFAYFLLFRQRNVSNRKIVYIFVLSIFILSIIQISLIYYEYLGFPVFRLQVENAIESLKYVRIDTIWEPLFREVLNSPVIGYGYGAIRQLITQFDEAHNYYLRVLIETGLIGLTLFICFIGSLLRTTLNIFNSGRFPLHHTVVALLMLALTTTMLIASIGQDTLYSSKIALPYYLLVGLINYFYHKAILSSSKERDAHEEKYIYI